MNNFKIETWNHLNEKSRWSFLQGDAGMGLINGIGPSYFFHEQEVWNDRVKELKKELGPKTFWEAIGNLFSSETKLQNALIKEKIIQGFAPTTLNVTLFAGDLLLISPKLLLGLKEEILASTHGFLMAQGYGDVSYKVYVEKDTVKALRLKKIK